jgi:O-antigen ligase
MTNANESVSPLPPMSGAQQSQGSRPPAARYQQSGPGALDAVDRRSSHRLAFAGLFLFTLLLYIRPNEMFPEVLGTFPLSKIVAVIALLAYLGTKLGRGQRLTIMPLELKMFGAIALLGVLFAPFAVAPQDSVDVLLDQFIKVLIIFVLMINVITTRERLRSIMSLVVICGTIMAALAIKSYLAGEFTVIEKKYVGVVGLRIIGAVGGIFGNPNDLATSLNMLLPLAVALALISSGMKRAIFFACSAVLAAGVIVTFSRGGFLGLVAMGAVLLWKVGRQNRAVTALAFAVMFGVFVLAMPGGYGGRITSMFQIGEDPTGSSQARRDLLERAASVAIHHPIVGVGMGNFHIYSIHEQVAHNSYIEIAAELGLAGLAAYLVLILAPLRSLRKIERETAPPESRGTARDKGIDRTREIYYLSIAVQAALVAYLICSFFGSIEYQWFLYYPVAYAVALRGIHAAEQPVSVPATHTPVAAIHESNLPRGVLWDAYRRRASRVPAVRAE